MPKGLVVYDSKTGNTEKMAVAINQGMERGGLEVKVKRVGSASLGDLTDADAIVFGTPTYYATISSNMKALIDKTVDIYPKLQDKVGAAFTSYDEVGAELTLLSLIQTIFVQKMVVVGHQSGNLGAISVGEPDDKCIAECQVFGKRIAGFTEAIAKKQLR